MGWAAHRFLLWSGALATALIMIFAVGLWRLMQGPIDIDRLTPSIQETSTGLPAG